MFYACLPHRKGLNIPSTSQYICVYLDSKLLQGPPWQSGFFKLTLTGTTMHVNFFIGVPKAVTHLNPNTYGPQTFGPPQLVPN